MKGGATYRFRSETAMLAWSGCPQPFRSRRDREFESVFLQGRVHKPSVPPAISSRGASGVLGLEHRSILPESQCGKSQQGSVGFPSYVDWDYAAFACTRRVDCHLLGPSSVICDAAWTARSLNTPRSSTNATKVPALSITALAISVDEEPVFTKTETLELRGKLPGFLQSITQASGVSQHLRSVADELLSRMLPKS